MDVTNTLHLGRQKGAYIWIQACPSAKIACCVRVGSTAAVTQAYGGMLFRPLRALCVARAVCDRSGVALVVPY